MRDLLNNRMTELRAEFEAGQSQFKELQGRQMRLQDTLLRISGAIQVLEELLAQQADQTLSPVEASNLKEVAAA